MKNCKFCNKPLKKPENPKVRNYLYCNKWCRQQSYRPYRTGWQQKRRAELAVPNERKIECLICHRWYVQVGSHIVQVHKMSARECREEMNLEVKKGLTKGWYWKLKGDRALENNTYLNLKKGMKYWFKKGQEGIGKYIRSPLTIEKLKMNRLKQNV